MFTKIKEVIKKYFGLIDDIAVDFLTDLKSLRYQLIIWAYALNGFVLYLIYLGKADYKLAGISIALLTAVYTFFFASRHVQAQREYEDKKNSDGENEAGSFND